MTMRPFHTVAVPHKDILEGKLTMEVFAADLWDTFQGRAPKEYTDPSIFFKKTYTTKGLKNLLDVVESRLKGKSGDPVLHVQTPFGGGKTHTLIAMYHKGKQWKAKPVVIVGTAMSGQDTMWGMIEKQLTGSIKKLGGNVAPGREALRQVIEKHEPVLILMDEVLEYVVKAAAVPVKDSTLAAQTMAFIQELTELAGTLEKTCVVLTLPSSMLEHYDTNAERQYQQLQKIAGRVERVYTPVQADEITKVIRKRLFSSIDEAALTRIISEFLEYAEKEGVGLLPAGKELSEYRDSFRESYPFIPEVIEVLYHRWGSFPTFQRTRGVLRLLSLVIYSLRESAQSMITLADFDLDNNEIKRELIKHIGPEYDSVVSADISNSDSGAKKIDKSLGSSLQGIRLGTRTATTVFMYSFSGGPEKGATAAEVKRSATTTANPSSVVSEALDQLKFKLFFFQSLHEKFYFSNTPNLNRILLTKMENIKEKEIVESEKELIKSQVSGSKGKFEVFLWPDSPRDVADSENLKLVILPQKSLDFIKRTLETKGDSPRVFRNTLFFLCPSETEKALFVESLKRKMAYQLIKNDRTIKLTEEHRKEIELGLKKEEDDQYDKFRKYYRLLEIPTRASNGLIKELDMGIAIWGEKNNVVQEVYDKLRNEGEIVEKFSPLVIRERYLKDNDFVKIQQIYDSMMKTPGEVRYVNRSLIESGLAEGVYQGIFGLGHLSNSEDTPVCVYFKENPVSSALDVNNVIISNIICLAQRTKPSSEQEASSSEGQKPYDKTGVDTTSTVRVKSGDDRHVQAIRDHVNLDFDIPRGKVSQIMGLMSLLHQKFESLHVELRASNGSISEDDYTNKVKEALKQLGIQIE